MARVSVFYDKELKERFFMVRGDEGYARSTTTELVLGERDEHLLNFDLDITVNVLRDNGEGQIVIYDNDVAVYVIDDWSSTDNNRTITLDGLTYDVTHNFYARYMGNSKCLASKSKTIGLFVENTHTAESILTIADNTVQFNPSVTDVAKTITLTNNSSESEAEIWNHYQQIEVFYDEISLGTYSTQSSNSISVNIPNVGDTGLHILKAVYKGRRELSSCTATQEIKVGYNMEINKINNNHAIVFGSPTLTSHIIDIHDWQGNSYVGEVYFKLIDNSNNTIIHQESLGNTNTVIGRASKKISYENISSTATDVNAVFSILGANNTEISVSKKVDVVKPTDLTVGSDRLFLIKNEVTKVAGKIYPEVTDAETFLYVNNNQISKAYTNDRGGYKYNVKGDGKGDKVITVKCGEIYKSITLPDYIQYWNANTFHNRNLAVYNADVDYLNMYTRIKSKSGESLIFGLPEPNLEDYELRIKFKANTRFSMGYMARSNDDMDWNSSENINTNFSVTTQRIPRNNTTGLSYEWIIRRVDGDVTIKGLYNEDVTDLVAENDNIMPRFLFVRDGGNDKLEIDITELILRGL